MVNMKYVETGLFIECVIGERESRRASTGAPRDRFGHIGWRPQLFPTTHPPDMQLQLSPELLIIKLIINYYKNLFYS